MNKNVAIGIGTALGSMLGVPLLFFIANTFFLKGNPAEKIIPQYIHNSREITVNTPEWRPKDTATLFNYKDTSYKSTLKKNGNGDLYKIWFYDAGYKKYFIILLYDYGSVYKDFFLVNQLEKKQLILTVNNEDLNNRKYGSKKNPVPVFKYRGQVPLVFGDFKYDITSEEYKYNVTQYLTYQMSKEEFQARFPMK